MEGHGHGAEPIVLLGWRVGYLAYFSIPINKIIKCIEFELIYHVISLNTASFFKYLNEFDFVFL